jgi:hypothetical protein
LKRFDKAIKFPFRFKPEGLVKMKSGVFIALNVRIKVGNLETLDF